MDQFYAYLWLRDDGTPYYVGKGKGRRAFRYHECISPPQDRTKILILQRESEASAFDTERELIRNWGRMDLGMGCLRNRTDGGDGSAGYQFPPERRQQVSQFMKGNKYATGNHPIVTPEISAKRVATRKRKGNYRPKGYKLTDEHKKNIGIAHQGKSMALETKEKLSAAHTGSKHTLESREKMSVSRRGHPVSPETREKIRTSNIATWAAKTDKTPWNKGKTKKTPPILGE